MEKILSNSLKQTQRIKPVTGVDSEIPIHSKFVKEALPLPFVLYPNIYGAFIGFAEKEEGTVFFCTCSERAIDNYIELNKTYPKGIYSDTLIMSPLSSHEFPSTVAKESSMFKENFRDSLRFKERVCHKCNLATPTVRAIHPMYGGKFKQYYNWYINQHYFHLGILQGKGFLEDQCPDEMVDLLEQIKKANEETREALVSLNYIIYGPLENAILKHTPNRNIDRTEASENYRRLEKVSRALSLKIANKVENMVRMEFGFRNVGEGWISESILFKIVQKLFVGHEILRHHRPKWLYGLELDIFIPNLRIAFEYQGQQHYYPIKAWGGDSGLKKVQERDYKKKQICLEEGIKLVIIDFSEPLTETHITALITKSSR